MARPVLRRPMSVTYEIRRTQEEPAVGAFDAGRIRRRVPLRPAEALALAETLVVHAEGRPRRRRFLPATWNRNFNLLINVKFDNFKFFWEVNHLSRNHFLQVP